MSGTLPELPAIAVDADEATTLLGFLDHYRVTLERQAHGLDATELATPLPPSDLTIGALLKHLAFVEGYWFRWLFAGADQTEPWRSADWDADPDWDLTSAAADNPEELRALFAREVAAARAVVDRALAAPAGLGALSARERHGRPVSLRWIVVHMVEEYARHCGHADLVRQSIDGTVDL